MKKYRIQILIILLCILSIVTTYSRADSESDFNKDFTYVFTAWQNVGDAYDCKYTSREESKSKDLIYLTHETCKQQQTRNIFIPNFKNNIKNQYLMQKDDRITNIIRPVSN